MIDAGDELELEPEHAVQGGMTSEITAALECALNTDMDAQNYLVGQGVAREAAIELIKEAGTPQSTESISEWADRVLGRPGALTKWKQELDEHHTSGVPTFEPPPRPEIA